MPYHLGRGILSALGDGAAVEHTLHQAPEITSYKETEEKKKSGFLLPLIAFIILAVLLALIFRACSGQKEAEPVGGSGCTNNQ